MFLNLSLKQDEEMDTMMRHYWDNLTIKEKQEVTFISNTEVCAIAVWHACSVHVWLHHADSS